MKTALVVVILVLLVLIYFAGRHRKCAVPPAEQPKTERACGACTERMSNSLARGFGAAYDEGAEHMVPTFNLTFRDSMRDAATDYYYDSRGMTMADYALERRMLAAN